MAQAFRKAAEPNAAMALSILSNAISAACFGDAANKVGGCQDFATLVRESFHRERDDLLREVMKLLDVHNRDDDIGWRLGLGMKPVNCHHTGHKPDHYCQCGHASWLHPLFLRLKGRSLWSHLKT